MELWEEIEKAYKGKKRFYHNLHHLQYMVSKAFEFKYQIQDFEVFLFSIFYHDIVYKATSKTNEEDSARLAQKRLTKLNLEPERIKHCVQQILATKTHSLTKDADTQLLLDIDMGVLGEDPDIYRNYKIGVRKEYSIFPDFLYRKGRKKVLEAFLASKSLYQTEHFKTKYEAQARSNILAELKSL